jgi:hypothetical protein
MRDRIRTALLEGRVKGIQALKSGTASGQTYCTNVGRGEYENATSALGNTPGIPNNPEQAKYLVCYDIQTQAPQYTKMFDPEKAEQESPEPLVLEGAIPAGTYEGTTDYTNVIETLWFPGTFPKNEIVINIDQNGIVTGSLLLSYIGDKTIVEELDNCERYWEIDIVGTFSGQVAGPADVIDLSEDWDMRLLGTCGDSDVEGDEEPLIRQLNIEVQGNLMSGSTLPHPDDPDGFYNWSLNANKK